jgi:hypothetical protein
VRYGQDEGGCRRQVVDDGIGAAGNGTMLVKALAGQMGGTVEWHYLPGAGAVVKLPSCET